MKEKSMAAILAFFLGGLGGHHFYLGNTGRGLLYAATCWSFIPSLVALVEAVLFISMSNDDFNRKYNQSFLVPDHELDNARYSNLEKLAGLKEKGILSDEEFELEKQKLVS